MTGHILVWGPTGHATCLFSSPTTLPPETLDPAELSQVPTDYLDLKEVFGKSQTATLPPHRPYDCSIDLLPPMSLHMGESPHCPYLNTMPWIPTLRIFLLLVSSMHQHLLPVPDFFFLAKRMAVLGLVLTIKALIRFLFKIATPAQCPSHFTRFRKPQYLINWISVTPTN